MKQPKNTTCKTHSFHLINKPFMANLIKSLWDVKKTWTHFKWRVLLKTSIYIVNNLQQLILTRITWLKSRPIYIKQFIFFSILKNRIKNEPFKYFATDWQNWDRSIVIYQLLFIFLYELRQCLIFSNYQERHQNKYNSGILLIKV